MQRKIASELDKVMADTEKELTDQMEGMGYKKTLPEKGWSKDRVLDEIGKVMKLGTSS